ncbi:MAG: hypothetical protein KDB03_04540 [Planctomycetales bacterium]|nr:hypothetical protein [Planctomycetales bacterium]
MTTLQTLHKLTRASIMEIGPPLIPGACLGESPWVPTILSSVFFPSLRFDGAMIAVQSSNRVIPSETVLRIDFILGSFLTSFGIAIEGSSIPEDVALISADAEIAREMIENSRARRITTEADVDDQSMSFGIQYSTKTEVPRLPD